jgi:hypothetical protein
MSLFYHTFSKSKIADANSTGVDIVGDFLMTSLLNGQAASYPATVKVKTPSYNGVAQGTAYTKDFDITVYGRPRYGIQLSPGNRDFDDAVENNYSGITGQIVTITGSLTLTLSDTTNFQISTTNISSIATGSSGQFTITPKDSLGEGEYTATVIVGGGNIGGQAEAQRTFTVSFEVVEAVYTITLLNNSGDAAIDAPHAFTGQVAGNYADQSGQALTVKVTPRTLLPAGSGMPFYLYLQGQNA